MPPSRFSKLAKERQELIIIPDAETFDSKTVIAAPKADFSGKKSINIPSSVVEQHAVSSKSRL